MDQQRIFQILSLLLSAIGLFIIGRSAPLPPIDKKLERILIILLLLGVLSSLTASSGEWAFIELALWVGLWGLMQFSALSCLREPKVMILYHVSAVIVAGLLLVNFFLSLMSAFVSGKDLIAKDLLSGFENLRWLGQFQALSIPMIGGTWMITQKPLWRRLIYVLLVFWWTTIWVGESRGAWLALTAALGFSLVLRLGPRQYYQVLGSSAILGLIIYVGLFHWLAPWLGMNNDARTLENLASSSSLRGEMWLATLTHIPDHPWLGWGGMAFAGSESFISGHPHNAFLQIAYEWGLPALACILAVIVAASSKLWPIIRQLRFEYPEQLLTLSTLQSLAVMLAHSMVSGVIVMPYTQVWLALMAGAAWSIAAKSASLPRSISRIPMTLATYLMVLIASTWLVNVAIRDYPRLTHFEEREGYGHDAPRFWLRGGIKLTTDESP
ncbi:O-antigen ligase family protein [Alcanivorax sediminis]|nr:O-antigen ligase family protein [Alcanivorax sediminis]